MQTQPSKKPFDWFSVWLCIGLFIFFKVIL